MDNGDTKKGLTKADICGILKKCSVYGVSKLKIGDLEIEFNRIDIEQTVVLKETDKEPVQDEKLMSEINKKAESADTATDEITDFEELMLSDPEKYEALQQSGELDGEESDDI